MSIKQAVVEVRSPEGRNATVYQFIASGHVNAGNAAARHPQTDATQCSIFVRRLQIAACLGLHDWEKAEKQPVVVDLEFGATSRRACFSDDISDAVDYSAVVDRLREIATERHFELVEALAERMADMLQSEFAVPWLRLSLSKLAPYPGAEVGISLERN